MLTIDFYYWGEQCPHSYINKRKINSLIDNKRYSINFYDISRNFKLAEELNIYSPNLIIFNNQFRWNGPISIKTIELFEQGKIPKREPYIVETSNNVITGTLKPLTEETVLDTYKPCAPRYGEKCCFAKANWIKGVKNRFNLDCLGYLHYYNGVCVGGAEFVPSVVVPYKIPKGNDIAFLTCVFLSDKNADYKSYPLEKLEKKIYEMGYKELITISSEKVVFPNGPLEWFEKHDYIDLGPIYYESNEYAKMHLVKKVL